MRSFEKGAFEYFVNKLKDKLGLKADKTYVDDKVKTDVPYGAKFTDTITTINGKTGAIGKADIVALGIPASDTNTTYTEITTAEIDAGTSTALRTITGRRVKYILDKVQIPTGLISMWSGLLTTVPEGWALCNGENGTPDLTDRFIVGAGSSYSVGDTGGEENVTLSSSQIPSHRHSSGTLSTSSDGDHSHSGSTASAGSHSHTEGTLEIGSVGTHTHGSGTYSVGSAGSHTHASGTLSTSTTGSHLHVQHYRSRHDAGAKGSSIYKLVGDTVLIRDTGSGGSHSHTISGSTASGGSHSHSVSGTSSSGGSHTHSISGSTSSTGSHSHSVTISSDGSHSHTVSGYTGYIGSSGSHENRPPYFALAFIMKL